jgi:RHS repeat-associated protein
MSIGMIIPRQSIGAQPVIRISTPKTVYAVDQRPTFKVRVRNYDQATQTIRATYNGNLVFEQRRKLRATQTITKSFPYSPGVLSEPTQGSFVVTVQDRTGRVNLTETVDITVVDASLAIDAPTQDEEYFSYQGNSDVGATISYDTAGPDELGDFTLEATLNETTDVSGDFVINTNSASATLPSVPEGDTTLDIALKDSQGNAFLSEQVQFTHIADSDAPVISIENLADGDTINTPSMTIVGTVDDENLEFLTLDGTPVANAQPFAIPYSFAEGSHTLTFQAQDRAGNVTTETLTVDADFTSPTVETTSHSDGEVTACTGIGYEGTTDDTGATHTVVVANPWNEDYATDNDGLGYRQEYTSPTIDSSGNIAQTIDLVAGQNTVTVRAQDSAGNESESTVFLYCDEEGPEVTIISPIDGEAMYGGQANVTIDHSDFLSSVDTGTATLTVTDSNGTDVTSTLTVSTSTSDTDTTGTITGWTEEETYTVTFSIADTLGNTRGASSTVYVAPSSVTPPTEQEGDGMIHGTVFDSDTCNEFLYDCDGLEGVEVTLATAGEVNEFGNLTQASEALSGTVITGADGAFSFPTPETATYWLLAKKDGYTYGQREIASTGGLDSAAGDIHLTPQVPAQLFNDTNGNGVFDNGEGITEIDENGGMAVASGTQSDGTAWDMTVDIPSGAVNASDPITELNLTWFEQVEYLPSGELPPGTAETFAFDLSGDDPTEDIDFNQDVTVTFSDTRGFPAVFPDTGDTMEIPVGYWNQDTFEWEHIDSAEAIDSDGDGVADAFTFETPHFSPFDCNDPVNEPEADKEDNDESDDDDDDQCSDVDTGNSSVACHAGDLSLEYALPTEQLMSTEESLSFSYNSTNADPSALVSASTTLDTSGVSEFTNLQWQLSVGGQTVDRVFYDIPGDGTYKQQFLFDGEDAHGNPLESGVYQAQVESDADYEGEYYWSVDGQFGGEPDLENGATGVTVDTTYQGGFTDLISINNLSDSPFGTGWMLDGMQQLFENEDGYIGVRDGQSMDQFYFANQDVYLDATQDALDGVLDFPQIAAYNQEDPNFSFFNHEMALSMNDRTVDVGTGPIDAVTNADGSLLYVANFFDDTVSIVNTSTNTVSTTVAVGDYPLDLLLTADDGTLYVLNRNDDSISVIDTSTQTVTDTITVGDQPIAMIMTSDESTIFVANNNDDTISAIDTASSAVSTTITSSGRAPQELALLPDDSLLYVMNHSAGSIDVIDVASQTLDTTIAVTSYPQVMQITPDGSKIVTVGLTGTMNIIDVATNTIQDTTVVDRYVYGLGITSDSQYAIVPSYEEDNVSIVDIGTANIEATVDVGTDPHGITMSADGTYAYVVNYTAGTMNVLDVANQEIINTVFGGSRAQNLHRSANDNDLFLLNVGDGSVTTYSETEMLTADGPTVQSALGTSSATQTHAVLSADQQTLLTIDYSANTLITYDMASGEELANERLSNRYRPAEIMADEEYIFIISHKPTNTSVADALVILDANDYSELALIDIGETPQHMTRAGDYAFVTNRTDGTVSAIDLTTFERADINGDGIADTNDDIVVDDHPQQIMASIDESEVYVLNKVSHTLSIIDVATLTVSATIAVGTYPDGLVSSPDGSTLYVMNQQDDSVSVIDVASQSEISQLSVGDTPYDIAINASGTEVYVANLREDSLSVINTSTQSVEDTINVGDRPVTIEVTPNEEYVYVTAFYSDAVSVVDVAQRSLLYNLPSAGEEPTEVFIQQDADSLNQTIRSLTDTDHTQLSYDTESSTYTRTYPDGSSIHFNEDGTHDTTTDRYGHVTQFNYDGDGLLTSVDMTPASANAAALTWTLEYDTDNHLNKITNPSGSETHFTVDGNGHLREIENPEGAVRSFTYDTQGHALSKTLETGETSGYRYDEYGRISAVLSPERATADADGSLSSAVELREYAPSDVAGLINDASNPISGTRDGLASPTTDGDIVADITDGAGNILSRATNSFGAVTSETDALGRTTLFDHDSENNVIQKTYPRGNAEYFTYDSNGYTLSSTRLPEPVDLTGLSDSDLPAVEDLTDGLTTQWTYEERYNEVKTTTDARGHVTTHTYDYELDTDNDGDFDSDDDQWSTYEDAYLSQGSTLVGNRWKTEYPEVAVYDTTNDSSNPSQPTEYFTYNENGQLLSATNENGTVTTYAYTTDGYSRLESVVEDPDGLALTTTYADFDAFGQPQTVTDPNGNVIEYEFDTADGMKTAAIQSVDIDNDGTNETIRREWTYDARNNVITDTQDAGGAQEVMTTHSYNAHDQLEQTVVEDTVTGESITTQYRYDANRNLAQSVDGNGHVQKIDYDPEDQITSRTFGWSATDTDGIYTESFGYNLNGQQNSTTHGSGAITRTTYDDYDRQESVIRNYQETPTGADDENLTTTTAYDDAGNVISTTQADGVINTNSFDALNRETERAADTAGENIVMTTDYDAAGNAVLRTDHRGVATQQLYDAVNRPQVITQDFTADGTTGKNLSTTTTYDNNGNVDTVTDHRGVHTRTTYNALNSPASVTQDYSADSSGENLVTALTYDRLGNVSSTTDPSGKVTTNTHDGFSRLTEEVIDDGGIGISTAHTYDSVGNVLTVTDDLGNETGYGYDALKRKTGTTYADGTTTQDSFNASGNRDERVTQNGDTLTYAYDDVNRLSTLTFPDGDTQSFTYDEMDRVLTANDSRNSSAITRTYNGLGETTSETQSDGTVSNIVATTYNYPAGSKTLTYPSGTEITHTMDTLDRLASVARGSNTILENTYNDAANTVERSYGNGVHTTRAADDLNRITSISSSVGQYSYTYDDAGNRTGMTRGHLSGNNMDAYAIDSADRVTGVHYNADSTTHADVSTSTTFANYAIDSLGNRLTVDDNGTQMTYGPNDGTESTNVMHQYDSIDAETLTYDDNGNLENDGSNRYTFDELNRLTEVTTEDGTGISYAYDTQGRRVRADADGTVTHYIYDGINVIEEQDSSGSTQREFVYRDGIDQPLQMADNVSSTTYTYHTDALGSVTELTDESGTLVEAYEYDIFGEPTIYDDSARSNVVAYADSIQQPYLFTARRYDDLTGNYFYRARYYSPSQGRFLSQDPLEFEDSENLYQYALNNPTRWIDPLGTAICGPAWYSDGLGDFFGTDYVAGADFSPACQTHDNCYGKCGSNRRNCDKAFYNKMIRICNRLPWIPTITPSMGFLTFNPSPRAQCNIRAAEYYLAVSSPFGTMAYNSAQEGSCCTKPKSKSVKIYKQIERGLYQAGTGRPGFF